MFILPIKDANLHWALFSRELVISSKTGKWAAVLTVLPRAWLGLSTNTRGPSFPDSLRAGLWHGFSTGEPSCTASLESHPFLSSEQEVLEDSLLTYEKHCVLLLAGQLLYSHQETGGGMWHLEADLPPKGLQWSWLAPLWAEHELNRGTIKINNGFFGVWCAQRPQ